MTKADREKLAASCAALIARTDPKRYTVVADAKLTEVTFRPAQK